MNAFAGPYHIHNGSLYRADTKICGASEKIAIAYDDADKRLLAHGSIDQIDRLRSRATKAAAALTSEDFRPDTRMCVIELPVNKITCDRLNACIADPSTLRALLAAGVI